MHDVGQLDHPAAFSNWVRRRSDKLRHDGRPGWQREAATSESPRVAVLLHVYFAELLPQIFEHLALIPVPFDLIVTNSTGRALEVPVDNLGGNVGRVRVLETPNCGRDIFPMISVVNAGILERYDVVFKVHTKRSEWREDHETLEGSGGEWRDAFLSDLAGSVERISEVLSAFADDPSIGIITADQCIVGPEHWGSDRPLTRELLRRLELPCPTHTLRFASGSIYWTRAFLLNGLRALDLTEEDFDEESGQIDGTTAHAVERIMGILAEEAGFSIRESASLESSGSESWKRYLPGVELLPEAHVYPFYLPQFHAFPENDAWWGTGFTEWANVASAKPVFPGHRQPNLPSDLGYYDLSNPTVQPRQFEMAQAAGIEGFMYYYYWFAGKKLMDLPVENHVASDENHAFCLMWANENWTRRWDGSEENVLIAQDYDKVPAEQFIDDVRHLITDPRYTRVNGKPLVAIYRITQIPNYREVVERWRAKAIELGLPGLHLVTVDVGGSMQGLKGDVRSAGLDGTLEFPPHNRRWVSAERRLLGLVPEFQGNVLRYDVIAEESEAALCEGIGSERYPGVLVNFDNTARRQHQPDLWVGSNPFTFRRWLRGAVVALQHRPDDERIVFVNAWNEWAEGAVLEPTQRFGRSYLQAVRSAVVCP